MYVCIVCTDRQAPGLSSPHPPCLAEPDPLPDGSGSASLHHPTTTTSFLLHLTAQLLRSVQYLAAQLFWSAPTQRILLTRPFVILAVV